MPSRQCDPRRARSRLGPLPFGFQPAPDRAWSPQSLWVCTAPRIPGTTAAVRWRCWRRPPAPLDGSTRSVAFWPFFAQFREPRKIVANNWTLTDIHLRYSYHTTSNMPRETTAFPLSLPAAPPGGSLYRWLYGELRAAILDGRLRPGARLPATRDLASAYHLSRATIVTAFDQLKSEGYVEGRSGSGT